MPRAVKERDVGRLLLSSPAARQQSKEDRQVFKPRNDFLDADDGDVYARHLRRETYVALVLDEDDCAGLGDGEVCARDAHPRGEKFAAQSLARDRRYLRDLTCESDFQLLREEFRDLLARLVYGGHDDVRRLLARELND